jgi:hypothetical protein
VTPWPFALKWHRGLWRRWDQLRPSDRAAYEARYEHNQTELGLHKHRGLLRREKRARDRAIRAALLALVIFAGFIAVAHTDTMDVGQQYQSKRSVCCNEFDGRPPEAIWDLSDGSVPNVHYRVMLEGQWVNVPDEAVLDVPNKFGVAVVWYSLTRGSDGGQKSFFIRCFLPGQLI